MTTMSQPMPDGWENFWWCWEPGCGARACQLPGVGILEAMDQHRDAHHPKPKKEEHVCPRCRSTQWVSVSLDGGWSRIAQCVPCGAYGDKLGPGWKAGG